MFKQFGNFLRFRQFFLIIYPLNDKVKGSCSSRVPKPPRKLCQRHGMAKFLPFTGLCFTDSDMRHHGMNRRADINFAGDKILENKKKRGSFSGHLGYVMATAGASVGLGNIWRFPYLAARYGGGAFLIVYIILAFTFGYTMLLSETALGRMTLKSPAGAFRSYTKNKVVIAGGWLNAIIPMIIVPYYCVIGGWVTKYLFEYLRGNVSGTASDGFFSGFIGNGSSSEFWFIVFAVLVILVIVCGVEKGIERVSKIMMPVLVVLAVIIAVYSMTRPGALDGVKYFLVPDLANFSYKTVIAALLQMFYSLSIAMGILFTYGSYMKKDVDIESSSVQVAVFDSGIAILAGLMIIPAVFAFSGGTADSLNAGPGLMFITIPKVFESMGFGQGIGILFFVLVLFAALTSAIALAETSVSTFQDEMKISRGKSIIIVSVIIIGLGTLSALGYNLLSNVTLLGMQMLDFFDFLSNSVMMPIAAFATCFFVAYIIKVKKVQQEIMISSPFRGRKLYFVMASYIAPLITIALFVIAILSAFGYLTL